MVAEAANGPHGGRVEHKVIVQPEQVAVPALLTVATFAQIGNYRSNLMVVGWNWLFGSSGGGQAHDQ